MNPEDDLLFEFRTRQFGWLVVAVLAYTGLKLPHQWHRFYRIFTREILENPSPQPGMVFFVAVLFLLLLMSGALLIVWFLWSFFGREAISIRQQRLVIQYNIGRFGPARRYFLPRIQNLRVDKAVYGVHSLWRGGNVAFEYEGKTRRLGLDLNEQESAAVVTTLQPYLSTPMPQLIRTNQR